MNNFRRWYLMLAELVDSYRIIPRMLVLGYSYLVYRVVDWYMHLQPYFPKDIQPMLGKLIKNSSDVQVLLVQAPTTQHAVLVTAVIGFGAAVFGLYTSTGIQWKDYVFKSWKFKNKKPTNEDDNTSPTQHGDE